VKGRLGLCLSWLLWRFNFADAAAQKCLVSVCSTSLKVLVLNIPSVAYEPHLLRSLDIKLFCHCRLTISLASVFKSKVGKHKIPKKPRAWVSNLALGLIHWTLIGQHPLQDDSRFPCQLGPTSDLQFHLAFPLFCLGMLNSLSTQIQGSSMDHSVSCIGLFVMALPFT
jgi:hypothetical protein